MATLTFRDGELRLRRVGGEAGFAFPFVTGTEHSVALGGSGPYRSSTGVFEPSIQIGCEDRFRHGALVGGLNLRDINGDRHAEPDR